MILFRRRICSLEKSQTFWDFSRILFRYFYFLARRAKSTFGRVVGSEESAGEAAGGGGEQEARTAPDGRPIEAHGCAGTSKIGKGEREE